MRTFESIRTLLQPWGELRSQPASDWNGGIPLPAVVADFYRELGPWGPTFHAHTGPVGLDINAGGNPVNVPTLRRLWGMQGCYRWHGLTGERLPDWQERWLVVGFEGSNPFILDMDDGTIHFDLAGGKPTPQLFAPDLATAFGAIATVANTLGELGEDAYDEGFELVGTARGQIVDRLARFLAGTFDADRMLEAWRWRC